MATLTVTETFRGASAEVTESGDRQFTRVFDVIADDDTTVTEVLEADGIPRYGEPFVSDSGAVDLGCTCRSVRARPREESPYIWLVEASYSSRQDAGGGGGGGGGPVTGGPTDPSGGASGDGGPGGSPGGDGGGGDGGGAGQNTPQIVEDPLSRPATFRWSSNKVLRPAKFDVNGTAITNSANAPFDPPVEKEEIRPVLVVQKNIPLANFNGSVVQDWTNAINSAAWMGFPAKSLRINDIQAVSASDNGVWYWDTTWTFEYLADLWNPLKVLDQGSYYIDAENQKQQFRSGTGAVLAKGLLDGGGDKLEPVLPPVYLEFDLYEEKDFKTLRLF